MRKRSKYRPKGIRLDNLSWVKAGFAKVGTLPKAGVDLKIKNHAALDAVMMGHATRDHVDVLIAAFNVAEALYRVNPDLGLPHAEDIKKAQDALYSMGKRGAAKGRFLFTGPEMQDIRFGMEIHDAQLDASTVRDMEKALDLVNTVILCKQARPIVETA
jgi:hypothetical protein